MHVNIIGRRAAIRIGVALAVMAAVASATASAKTEAKCKQQYVARKAAGEAKATNQASYVKACLTAADPPPAADASQGAADANKLREAAQNPVANLISVQLQDNLGFNYGPYNAAQNILNFQPVIPIHLNADWNLITRWVSPIVYQPETSRLIFRRSSARQYPASVLSPPANPGKLIWGVGAVTYLPTATDKTLGVNAGAAPGVVVLTIQEPWVVGALANNVWAWRNGQQVDEMTAQYFINYNLPDGWYLTSQPIITADWRAPAHDKWVVPFGGGVGRLFRVGKQPINAQVQAFYNAVRPTVGPLTGPTWSLRFQISLLFPS